MWINCRKSKCSIIQVFWNVTLYYCASSLWHFKGLQCLHLLSEACHEEYLTQTVKTRRYFKMLGTTCQITWYHIPQDSDLQQHTTVNPRRCVQILNWTKQGSFPEHGLQVCTHKKHHSKFGASRLGIETTVFLVMRGLVHSSCQFSLADTRYHFYQLRQIWITLLSQNLQGGIEENQKYLASRGCDLNLGSLEHKVPPCCGV